MSSGLHRTPLYDRHQRHGARFVPFAGYEMPVQYQGVVAEHEAVRTSVGLFDVSHMGELWLRGPDATRLVDRLITNDLGRLPVGKGLYTCCCKDDGGILDDLIVYRVDAEEVLVVCNASNRAKIVAHFEAHCPPDSCADESDLTALIAVQGPRALATVARLTPKPLPAKRFEIQRLELAGAPSLVARTGYTGEDGVEIFCPNAHAEHLWDALLAAGSEFGATPVGLAARDTLRLEARLALYGNDIDESTHPYEAGLGWTVKPEKAEFVGKAALAERRTDAKRTLVGFQMTGRGVARHGYPLLDVAGNPVGHCTSGAPSPTLGQNIGLGYLPLALAGIGTSFLVDCRGRQVSARVVSTPFYKRD
jgi:aminomethyltransferase